MNAHLKETNETYFEHMFHAIRYGFRMILAGFACIIHAIIPDLFVTTASDTIKGIIDDVARRKENILDP